MRERLVNKIFEGVRWGLLKTLLRIMMECGIIRTTARRLGCLTWMWFFFEMVDGGCSFDNTWPVRRKDSGYSTERRREAELE